MPAGQGVPEAAGAGAGAEAGALPHRRAPIIAAVLAAALGCLSGAHAQPGDPLAATDSIARAETLHADSTGDSTTIARAARTLVSQARDATPETLAVEPVIAVPVFLGSKEIYRVRSARDGLSPGERAAAIRDRLTAAVRRREVPADSVRLVATPQGIEVRFADQFLWMIAPGDVGHLPATELAGMVAELPDRVRTGILRERAGRRPVGVLISVALAALITLVAWIALRILLAVNRRWRAWLQEVLPRRLGALRIGGFEVVSHAQMTGLATGLLARADVVIGALLLYAYVTLVLSLFPWTQGWSWHLFDFAARKLFEMARAIAGAIPNLMIIVIIFLVFRWLTSLSDRFFDAVGAGAILAHRIHPELARPSKRLVKILLWIVAVIIAYPYVPGADTRAVQGVSLLIGVMVSLGSTGLVGNVIAGIVLTYSRSFRVGDRVKIGEQTGDVTSLGFFATKIRTLRNEELTLPNGLVALQPIVNYTRLAETEGLILHTQVTIGYDVDWRRVHALLVEAAGRVEGVEREPAPWVFQRALNDHHVSYELNCITRLSHPQLRLYSDLHQEIQDAFARAGVEILSPGYHAVRDANAAVLPGEPSGPRSGPGGFRIRPPG